MAKHNDAANAVGPHMSAIHNDGYQLQVGMNPAEPSPGCCNAGQGPGVPCPPDIGTSVAKQKSDAAAHNARAHSSATRSQNPYSNTTDAKV